MANGNSPERLLWGDRRPPHGSRAPAAGRGVFLLEGVVTTEASTVGSEAGGGRGLSLSPGLPPYSGGPRLPCAPPEASVLSSVCKAGVLVAPSFHKFRESEVKWEASNLLTDGPDNSREGSRQPWTGAWGRGRVRAGSSGRPRANSRVVLGATWLRWGRGRGLPSAVKARDRSPLSRDPHTARPLQ